MGAMASQCKCKQTLVTFLVPVMTSSRYGSGHLCQLEHCIKMLLSTF